MTQSFNQWNLLAYFKYVALVAAGGYLAMGGYLMLNPTTKLAWLTLPVALVLVVGGLSEFANTLTKDRQDRHILEYVQAGLTLLAGGLLLGGQFTQQNIALLTVVSLWLLLSAGLRAGMVALARRRGQKLLVHIISGVVLALLGFLLLLHPVFPQVFIASLLALAFLVQAVVALVTFFKLNRFF